MEFVPTRGSRLVVQHKDKKKRIAEALTDLQLVLAGIASDGEVQRDANPRTLAMSGNDVTGRSRGRQGTR